MKTLKAKKSQRIVQTYIKKAETEINQIQIFPRAAYRHPFDIVALAIVSKGFALSKACLKLLQAGLKDEAYGLSRSLVECANNVRFLTANPSLQDKRTRDFAKFHLADKAYWMHNALKAFAGQKREREIRKYARQLGVTPDYKSALRGWSGPEGSVWKVTTLVHPLDTHMTDLYRKLSYAVDYYQTSAYVHCWLPGVDAYCTEEGVPFKVSPAGKLALECEPTLLIILVYLHNLIAYALYGMNMRRPLKLADNFQQALARIQYTPRWTTRQT